MTEIVAYYFTPYSDYLRSIVAMLWIKTGTFTRTPKTKPKCQKLALLKLKYKFNFSMFSMLLIFVLVKSVISRSNASETFLTEGLQGKEYKLDHYKELRNSQPQEVTQGNKLSYMA